MIGGGFKFTFGESQAAMNLMGNILQQSDYQKYQRIVCRKLSKQIEVMKAMMFIENKTLRKATLKLWHEKFTLESDTLPEIIKTHMRCVETGIYRQLLKDTGQPFE